MTEQDADAVGWRPSLSDLVRFGSGLPGGATTAILWHVGDFAWPLAVSIGLNVSLFLFAYTLYEGWDDA